MNPVEATNAAGGFNAPPPKQKGATKRGRRKSKTRSPPKVDTFEQIFTEKLEIYKPPRE